MVVREWRRPPFARRSELQAWHAEHPIRATWHIRIRCAWRRWLPVPVRLHMESPPDTPYGDAHGLAEWAWDQGAWTVTLGYEE